MLLAEVLQREKQTSPLLDLLKSTKVEKLVDENNEFMVLKASLLEKCPPEILATAIDWATNTISDASGAGGRWLRDDWQIWRLLTQAYAASDR